jgi:hypothetical protein
MLFWGSVAASQYLWQDVPAFGGSDFQVATIRSRLEPLLQVLVSAYHLRPGSPGAQRSTAAAR